MRKVILMTITFVITMVPLTTIFAQTTDFTYQGSLEDGANPANGNFDFEFLLYSSAAGGTQIGLTNARSNVGVAGGVFSVTLDFGAGFPGADRFLEIRVRQGGSGGFTILAPRQKVNSAPYSIRSQTAGTADTATNAIQLGGVAANQFVQTGDPRLSDARDPTAGSANYIQNSVAPQASTNFNISGNGTVGGNITAGIVRANSHFSLGANVMLSSTGFSGELFSNTFAGVDSGQSTVPAFQSGEKNSFFGNKAGRVNSNGKDNSLFGFSAGVANTSGNGNAFFGTNTGFRNTNGSVNTFFGAYSGFENTSGSANTFLGYTAGDTNTTGNSNTFVGNNAGDSNTTGSNNTLLGANTSALVNNLQFATAIGAGSDVLTSNTVVLGRRNGGDFVFVPGPVSLAGSLSISSQGILSSGPINASEFRIGSVRILDAPGDNNDNNTVLGRNSDVAAGGLTFATAIGAGAIATESNSLMLGRSADIVYIPGFLRLAQLGGAGMTAVCRNNANTLGTCSSSLRYKTNIGGFSFGLDLIKRLRPITFDWKDGGMHDVGLGAEDVAVIEPLLVTYNEDGQVEGVKYDRIGVVLINAVKEQQITIEAQAKQIEELKKQNQQQRSINDSLIRIVCKTNTDAEICKGEQQ